MVILMELRTKEIGRRRAGTEDRDTKQAAVLVHISENKMTLTATYC